MRIAHGSDARSDFPFDRASAKIAAGLMHRTATERSSKWEIQ
jgi:hypothetical protein